MIVTLRNIIITFLL